MKLKSRDFVATVIIQRQILSHVHPGAEPTLIRELHM